MSMYSQLFASPEKEALAETTVDAAYAVSALIRTARLAIENDTSGGDAASNIAGACATIEIAEGIAAIAIDGAEFLTREYEKLHLPLDCDDDTNPYIPKLEI